MFPTHIHSISLYIYVCDLKNGTHAKAFTGKLFKEMCTMCTINTISLTRGDFFEQ